MLTFKDYSVLQEDTTSEKKHSLHAFDLDDTLVHHENNHLRVHVLNSANNRVQTLSNKEFNTHTLPEGHKYDFSEFNSSDLFSKTAKPIHQMITKLSDLHKKSEKTEIITARGDMDNQQKFAHHMKKFGIDINNTHVSRAGNKPGKVDIEKSNILHDLIQKHGYNSVHLYDDNEQNINTFLKLKSKHPEVELHGHHVVHHYDTGKTEVNTKKV